MTLTPEQFVATQKANVETFFGLSNKAFEGVEKLIELNMQVVKAAMAEAAETSQAALSVKDPQELFALQAALMQPSAEKAAAYSRHLYEIFAGTGAEVTKVAESTVAESQKNVTGTVRVKLYKGNIMVGGRKSPVSLYNPAIATMEADPTKAYNQDDATGFIRLNALRLKVAAQVQIDTRWLNVIGLTPS